MHSRNLFSDAYTRQVEALTQKSPFRRFIQSTHSCLCRSERSPARCVPQQRCLRASAGCTHPTADRSGGETAQWHNCASHHGCGFPWRKRAFSSVFLLSLRERCATRRRLLKESTKGGSGCSLSSKTSPFFSTLIVSPPV